MQERQTRQGVETARIVYAHPTLPLDHKVPSAVGSCLLVLRLSERERGSRSAVKLNLQHAAMSTRVPESQRAMKEPPHTEYVLTNTHDVTLTMEDQLLCLLVRSDKSRETRPVRRI